MGRKSVPFTQFLVKYSNLSCGRKIFSMIGGLIETSKMILQMPSNIQSKRIHLLPFKQLLRV